MSTPRFDPWSSIGKKLLTGLTGIFAMLFIVGHLAGNLTLIAGSDAFNAYADALHQLGALVYVAEIGLVVLFGAHAIAAIQVWRDKKAARSTPYQVVASKGGPSKQTVASRSMIVTGLVLLAFLIIHIIQFRFGAWYSTVLGDHEVRDLYRLVHEVFQNPLWVIFYVGVMLLLASHLRHGFWSAFQSLGASCHAARSIP